MKLKLYKEFTTSLLNEPVREFERETDRYGIECIFVTKIIIYGV